MRISAKIYHPASPEVIETKILPEICQAGEDWRFNQLSRFGSPNYQPADLSSFSFSYSLKNKLTFPKEEVGVFFERQGNEETKEGGSDLQLGELEMMEKKKEEMYNM